MKRTLTMILLFAAISAFAQPAPQWRKINTVVPRPVVHLPIVHLPAIVRFLIILGR